MSCCADQIDCCESEVVDDVPGSVEDCPFECAFKEHLEAARLRLSRETAGQLRLQFSGARRLEQAALALAAE